MKKLFFNVVAMMLLGTSAKMQAQAVAVIPDVTLPTVAGPVLRPQNAGSSTLQNITFNLGGTVTAVNNLYVHSWDVFSSAANNGIAWRRTNAANVLQNQGHVIIPFAEDIDVVLYEANGTQFVLAAYYFNDPANPATRGHYYRICTFTPGGVVLGAPVLLTLSASFGRINVDANTIYGVAIIWCVPGTGIYVKAAQLPGVAFGCNLLLPGTAGFKDPDVAIRRSSGVLDLDIVYLSNAENLIRKFTISLFNVETCSLVGLTLQHSVGTANLFGVPRIDCPDQLSTAKWTYVYSEYANVPAPPNVNVNESIRAVVFNSGVSLVPTNLLVRNAVYVTGFYQRNNPVLAYDAAGNQITVGWITRENTAVIPGTTSPKYLAQYVSDPGPGLPVSVPGSIMMVSNTQGGPFPVLAFSGQNNQSGFDGLNAAFSQYSTTFPGNYSMQFKHKPFANPTFRTMAPLVNEETEVTADMTVYPMPFKDQLTVLLPVKGHYSLSVLSIDGKVLISKEIETEANALNNIQSEELPSGFYFLSIQSPENNINELKKIVRE